MSSRTRARIASSCSSAVRPSAEIACEPLSYLAPQPGHADLEELVEVAGEDGQEPHALEQRIADVTRLVEHAFVELEPRQLAVEDRESLVPRGPSATAAGSARTGCGSNGGHGPHSDRTWPGRGRDDTCDPIPVGPPRIPRRRTNPAARPPVRGGFRCDAAPPA